VPWRGQIVRPEHSPLANGTGKNCLHDFGEETSCSGLLRRLGCICKNITYIYLRDMYEYHYGGRSFWNFLKILSVGAFAISYAELSDCFRDLICSSTTITSKWNRHNAVVTSYGTFKVGILEKCPSQQWVWDALLWALYPHQHTLSVVRTHADGPGVSPWTHRFVIIRLFISRHIVPYAVLAPLSMNGAHLTYTFITDDSPVVLDTLMYLLLVLNTSQSMLAQNWYH
jgi:hypothetical protein